MSTRKIKERESYGGSVHAFPERGHFLEKILGFLEGLMLAIVEELFEVGCCQCQVLVLICQFADTEGQDRKIGLFRRGFRRPDWGGRPV
jgi:hypothetical protein